MDVAVKKESKYLCSAKLTSHQALWQHQRRQKRREKKAHPSQAPPVPLQNGRQSAGPAETDETECMGKYSEAGGGGEEASSSAASGETTGLSLAESFLLG